MFRDRKIFPTDPEIIETQQADNGCRNDQNKEVSIMIEARGCPEENRSQEKGEGA